MIRFVLVPSDMAGKPIAGALARTFPNDTVITQMMCESLITDYGSEEAEGVFMSFDGIVYDVKRRIEVMKVPQGMYGCVLVALVFIL